MNQIVTNQIRIQIGCGKIDIRYSEAGSHPFDGYGLHRVQGTYLSVLTIFITW